MIRKSLVSEDAVIPGASVDIRCAHGDVVAYPVANTTIIVKDHEMETQA